MFCNLLKYIYHLFKSNINNFFEDDSNNQYILYTRGRIHTYMFN